MEILYQFENWENYEKTAAVFDKLNGIVEEDKAYWLDAAKTFGREFANDEVFYVLGCGPLEGTAYSMANCHLIEMQTRHAVLVPSGDYFHGPFETTTKDLPMILLESNGKSRPLDERASMPKYLKEEWAFFLDERGRKKYCEFCKNCERGSSFSDTRRTQRPKRKRCCR